MEGDPAAAKSDLAFPKVPRAFVQGDHAVASSPLPFPEGDIAGLNSPVAFPKRKGSLPKGRGLLQKARGELGKAPVLLPKDEAFTKKTPSPRPSPIRWERVAEGRLRADFYLAGVAVAVAAGLA